MSAILAPIISFFQNLIGKQVKKQLRMMTFTFSAAAFILLGVVFISSGLVEGIALSLPHWVAYGIVGVILAVIGLFILLIGMITKE
jgi:type IV secretory pathway VirB6-like protein